MASNNVANETTRNKEVGDCATTSLRISTCNPLKKQFSWAPANKPKDVFANDMNFK